MYIQIRPYNFIRVSGSDQVEHVKSRYIHGLVYLRKTSRRREEQRSNPITKWPLLQTSRHAWKGQERRSSNLNLPGLFLPRYALLPTYLPYNHPTAYPPYIQRGKIDHRKLRTFFNLPIIHTTARATQLFLKTLTRGCKSKRRIGSDRIFVVVVEHYLRYSKE